MKRAMAVVVALVCALGVLVSGGPSEAQSGAWRPTNPGGSGAFNSPVITAEGHWAVGSDLGGVYLSTDRGATWAAVGASRGLTVTHVASMAPHPDGRLLIGTDDGVFVASAGGAARVTQARDGGYVAAIAVSADPDGVYAAVHPQWDALAPFVIRSTDGGRSWSATGSNLPANLRVTGLRTHPVDPDGVWVITGEGRFNTGPARAYFSTDGGRAFTRLDPNQGDLTDVAYALDPANLNLMYATTVLANGTGQVFRSTDTGFTWTNITPAAQKPSGIILADPSNPARVRIVDLDQRAGTPTYLWESTNAGDTWTSRSLSVQGGWSRADERWGLGSSFQGLQQTIGYDPATPGTVLWVNSQFLYTSADGGRTWRDGVSRVVNRQWISRGIDNVVPIVVEPSNANRSLIYAGYMDMGLWRSDNGGATWRSLNVPAFSGGWGNAVGGNTLSVAADPNRAGVVWAQVGGDLDTDPMFLLKSTNRGNRWTRSDQGLPSPARRLEGLSVDPASPRTSRWLTVTANGDVYLSRNDGRSWERVLDCPADDCHRTYHTADNGVIALSPSGIWRSWQGGAAGSWERMNLPASMTAGWTPGQHWLMDSWTHVGPADLASRPGELWVAVVGQGKGLYRSADYGQTWTRVLADDHLRTVAADSRTGNVYAGSSSAMQAGSYQPTSRGLLRSANGVSGWTADNAGLAYPFATNIRIGPTGTPWLISPGQGITTR